MRIKIAPRIHRLEVSNISQLDEFWFPDIIIKGTPWKIKVSKSQYFCVYLYCEDKTRSYVATATVKLVSEIESLTQEMFTEPEVFDSDLGTLLEIVPWSDVITPLNGYVTENDSIILTITIKSWIYPDEKTKLAFETVDKCCDKSGLAIHRLTITNIDSLVAIISPKFILRKMPWRLSVYKAILGHLSIRLESKDGTQDVTCKVILSATLKCQVISNSIEMKASKKFLSYNTLDLHWKELSWDQVLNPENGFVINDQVIIEVEIKADKPEGINRIIQKRKAKNTQSKVSRNIQIKKSLTKRRY